MTKATMPEPVAWITRTKTIGPDYGKEHFGKLPVQSLNPLTYEHEPLITTTQAEAYAAAKVREALEEAIAAVESCRTTGTIRHGTVSDCIEAIRALLPSTPARPESEQ